MSFQSRPLDFSPRVELLGKPFLPVCTGSDKWVLLSGKLLHCALALSVFLGRFLVLLVWFLR